MKSAILLLTTITLVCIGYYAVAWAFGYVPGWLLLAVLVCIYLYLPIKCICWFAADHARNHRSNP